MTAKMRDINLLFQAGINPKTGLPEKFKTDKDSTLKEDIKKMLRIMDEQTAVNRYVWYNLPDGISSQELERMLYYKGQLAFFYLEDLEQFFVTPYALNGTIDFYGRYNHIKPVPMSCGTDDKGTKAQAEYLSTKKLKCIYDVKLPEELSYDDLVNSAVLIHDYSKQLSQTIIPRQSINDPLLDVMAECIPLLNTNLIQQSGVKGLRVSDADQSDAVAEAAKSYKKAALKNELYVPIVGAIEYQDINSSVTGKSTEYMLALQSLNNLRLASYGIDNSGLFEKKTHILESENQVNSANTSLVFDDGLAIRQRFCNIINSIWDLGIWCEPSESITQIDINGDGVNYNRDVTNNINETDNSEGAEE